MDSHILIEKFNGQKEYFSAGHTLSLKFRLEKLQLLRAAIKENEELLLKALYLDLKKAPTEAYGAEVGFVLEEIRTHIKHLKKWMKPIRVGSPLVLFPARSYLTHEPKGTVLIISPWNYPVQLVIAPLVGAIAAGNTAIIKPSEKASHTSKALCGIINSCFEENYIHVLEGGSSLSEKLLKLDFDHIFFTGSTRVGKIVLKQAAENMVPVTLELGGKSPAIVDRDVDPKLVAKRIVWGKLINAGQTCIAPDYLLVHDEVADSLLEEMVKTIHIFFGKDPSVSEDYPAIIDLESMHRLIGLLKEANIYHGGRYDLDKLYFEPTILTEVNFDMPIMNQEIFGPLLPLIRFKTMDEAIQLVAHNPSPLALYFFSNTKKHINKVLNQIACGGVCINDTLMHIANSNLPFGGVGNSGMGKYHGWYSFTAFSNQKPVVYQRNIIDIPLRYAPYVNKLKWIKMIMK